MSSKVPAQIDAIFDKELGEFLLEFETVLRSEMKLRKLDPQFFWKDVRDQVIHKYWVVDLCYGAHGIATKNKTDYRNQSDQAHMGKKVAGSMHGILARLTEEYNAPLRGYLDNIAEQSEVELIPPQSKQDKKDPDNKRRFSSRGPIVTNPPSTRKDESISAALVEVLKEVKKGQYTWFDYDNQTDAFNDQQLVGHATRNAGWYNGLPNGSRPYKTRLKQVSETCWRVEVHHLDRPVVSKK